MEIDGVIKLVLHKHNAAPILLIKLMGIFRLSLTSGKKKSQHELEYQTSHGTEHEWFCRDGSCRAAEGRFRTFDTIFETYRLRGRIENRRQQRRTSRESDFPMPAEIKDGTERKNPMGRQIHENRLQAVVPDSRPRSVTVSIIHGRTNNTELLLTHFSLSAIDRKPS